MAAQRGREGGGGGGAHDCMSTYCTMSRIDIASAVAITIHSSRSGLCAFQRRSPWSGEATKRWRLRRRMAGTRFMMLRGQPRTARARAIYRTPAERARHKADSRSRALVATGQQMHAHARSRLGLRGGGGRLPMCADTRRARRVLAGGSACVWEKELVFRWAPGPEGIDALQTAGRADAMITTAWMQLAGPGLLAASSSLSPHA